MNYLKTIGGSVVFRGAEENKRKIQKNYMEKFKQQLFKLLQRDYL